MPIMFNTLLLDAGVRLSDVRLLRHRDRSARKGRSPLDLWRQNRPAFDRYQRIQEISNRSKFGRASYAGNSSRVGRTGWPDIQF
jgi:hypothetical protein